MARGLKFRKGIVQSSYVAKTKVLISCEVTLQLILAFVSAYAKSRFSHVVAHFPLFSDIVRPNGVDQTVPRGAVLPGSSLCYFVSIFWSHCRL